jgi:hypothetical protein
MFTNNVRACNEAVYITTAILEFPRSCWGLIYVTYTELFTLSKANIKNLRMAGLEFEVHKNSLKHFVWYSLVLLCYSLVLLCYSLVLLCPLVEKASEPEHEPNFSRNCSTDCQLSCTVNLSVHRYFFCVYIAVIRLHLKTTVRIFIPISVLSIDHTPSR